MKVSKYTFFFDIEDKEFYIYNSISNALIEIDKNSYQILIQKRENRTNLSTLDIDKELYDVLMLKKFITENDLDNFLLYKSILTEQRADISYAHLTIAPTMDCCFNCHYCFEKYKTPNYITETIMDSIVKYLNSLKSKPKLKLTWFGGEPLMALSQIEKLYEKIATGYKKPTNSNIITTGFHINPKVIEVLKKIGISQIQITLDGLKNTHNKIKYTKGTADVFSKIIENISLILNTSNIHVVIRVNLTKKNSNEYITLYDELVYKFKNHQRFGISPAFVLDRGVSRISCSCNPDLYTPTEVAEFVINLQKKHNIHSPFLHYPSRFFTECAIRNEVAISFDPEGFAYKCWEVIGNKEYSIGRLDNNGKLQDINEVVLNRQLYGADPLEDPVCSKCKFLPICCGGCPIQRLENVFDGKKNNTCSYYKGKLEEFLKIHIALKKAGIKNTND